MHQREKMVLSALNKLGIRTTTRALPSSGNRRAGIVNGRQLLSPSTVTVVEIGTGENKETSWVWKSMQQFTNNVKGQTMRFGVHVIEHKVKQSCGTLLAYESESGTRGLATRIKNRYPTMYVLHGRKSIIAGVGSKRRGMREQPK